MLSSRDLLIFLSSRFVASDSDRFGSRRIKDDMMRYFLQSYRGYSQVIQHMLCVMRWPVTRGIFLSSGTLALFELLRWGCWHKMIEMNVEDYIMLGHGVHCHMCHSNQKPTASYPQSRYPLLCHAYMLLICIYRHEYVLVEEGVELFKFIL